MRPTKKSRMAFLALAATLICASAGGESLNSIKGVVKGFPAKAAWRAANTLANPVAVAVNEDVPFEDVQSGTVYTVPLTEPVDERTTQIIQAKVLERTPELTAERNLVALPDILRVRDSRGDIVDLKAYAVGGRPLTYLPDRARYVASVKVGVFPLAESWDARTLSAPIVFEVLNGGIAGQTVARVQTTSPPFVEVALEFEAEPRPRIVQVSTPAHPSGISVPLSVQPTIHLSAERLTIQGYGLETSRLKVFVTGLDNPRDHPIALSSSTGFIDSPSTITDAGGYLTATLRSEETGVATITASMPGLAPARAQVAFAFPTSTIIGSLIGGLLGGLIRLLSATISVRAGDFIKGLLLAVLIGALVFALYAVGVNTLPIQPTVTVGTVLVIVISAVGAYLGNLALVARSNNS